MIIKFSIIIILMIICILLNYFFLFKLNFEKDGYTSVFCGSPFNGYFILLIILTLLFNKTYLFFFIIFFILCTFMWIISFALRHLFIRFNNNDIIIETLISKPIIIKYNQITKVLCRTKKHSITKYLVIVYYINDVDHGSFSLKLNSKYGKLLLNTLLDNNIIKSNKPGLFGIYEMYDNSNNANII